MKSTIKTKKEEQDYPCSSCSFSAFSTYSIKSPGWHPSILQSLAMLDRHSQEMDEAIKSDDDFVYRMFVYELCNHEYCITYDLEPTLCACGLDEDDVLKDERLLRLLKKTKADYLASCY